MREGPDRGGGVEAGSGRESGVVDRVAFVRGAAAGVGAYLLGYLATYVTQAGAVRDRLSGLNFLAELFGGEGIAAWQGVGWYFYNAHFVATVSPSFGGGTRSTNFLATAEANLAYLYVVPPVALLAAGVAVAALRGADDPADGAVAALGVVPAYFLLAVVGAFAFAYGAGDAGSVHPEYVTAALLAGVVYPAVFGGIGGAIGSFAVSR
ncbi:transporter [Halobaculum sp. CBA1158]|uniref:transporter n=1 Tax=Halobaculum sp. CBA1158 TaxID=2904243 RepID=UPI001F3E2D62|nr:transporter [Halobaculum sp. CBA1158]UIP01140.1 transporter [Halobaculum sp. CBA1158]